MAASPLKDVLLVGFGAVGAIYSLILKRSNLVRLTVVARSNYELVEREGIHFKSSNGNIRGWRPDRVCKSVHEATDRAYSYVVVATKAVPELVNTPTMLAPLLLSPYSNQSEQPTYLLLQNGLNVEHDLYNAIKRLGKVTEPSIVSAAVWIGTNLLEPNVVEHSTFGRVTLGVYRHDDHLTTKNNAEEQVLLEDIGGILSAGGGNITIVPEIQRMKFAKNFWNVAFSSLSTLTGYTLPAVFRPPPTDPSQRYSPYVSPTNAEAITVYTIPAMKAILMELLTLGRALGYPDSEDGIPSSMVESVINNTKKLHIRADSFHKPSMMLDAERGQPMEVEVILGEVVRMARNLNVDVPRVETLYALLLVVQNQILRQLENH